MEAAKEGKGGWNEGQREGGKGMENGIKGPKERGPKEKKREVIQLYRSFQSRYI